MNIAFFLGTLSFALCMGLTPLCRWLALRFDLVDHPDEARKFHNKPVPRLGGVPIVLAYAGTLLLVLFLIPPEDRLHIRHHQLLWSLLPAAAIVFLTGLLDDLIGLKPWQKLIGQLTGAAVAVGLGSRLAPPDAISFAGHTFVLSPWIGYPLAIGWLIGCTNALNLIDGLDGLASGVGLLAAVTTLLAGILTGNHGLVLATMPLVGALLAFLYFNFSPASIFLGDCGSLTIGFVLGCFGLVWSQHGGSLLGMAGPLMAFALPLLDVGLAIGRRYLRRVPIFQGDRGHIHHMILARGFNPRQVAIILYGVCTVAASLALLQSFARSYVRAAVIVAFFTLVWTGIKYLDYVEIGAARRAMSRKRVLRHVRDEIYLQELGRSLQEAQSIAACWDIVCKVCSDMEFDTVEMRLEGRKFQTSSEMQTATFAWKITLPLGEHGKLILGRQEHHMLPRLNMAAIERLQEHLTERAETFSPASVSMLHLQKAPGDGERKSKPAA